MKIQDIQFKEQNSSLTCYLQDLSAELPQMDQRPAVLIFPGGAYKTCSDREAEPVALAYLSKGYNAFVLRYTVTGHDNSFPAEQVFAYAYQEACDSLSYLHEHAEELHIDANEIAVCGFSAGANLAAALGTMSQLKPAALILGYASVDKSINDDLGIKEPCMIDQVTKTTPPSFLFATQGDTVVPSDNTLLFAHALYLHKVPYEIHIFATGDHGLSLAEKFTGQLEPDVRQWFSLNLSFLEHIFSKKQLLWSSADTDSLSINSRLDMLMTNPQAKAVLQKYIPQFIDKITDNPQVNGISLQRISQYANGAISKELLQTIDHELKNISAK